MSNEISNITIFSGYNKNKEKESFESIKINTGEIVCLVGPTGSGKSRLLADIEYMANCDTLSNRKIIINEHKTKEDYNFGFNMKLTSQLSQNMNFIMDLSVQDLLKLHTDSSGIEDNDEIINKIIYEANKLVGEKFSREDNITSLSGGQSRALMIADIAFLSTTQIVLIDEIENAGINKEEALKLLIKEDKIVFISTHDPLIALTADKRLVINNGGIIKIIKTNNDEKQLLEKLKITDNLLQEYKELLRSGELLK